MFRDSEKFLLEHAPCVGDDRDAMKFTLVIRGNLPPDKRSTADAKHRLRRELHPQLRVLWQQHPHLKNLWNANHDGEIPVQKVANNFSRCGFRFVPLVRNDNGRACWLDILLLRREEPHRLFSGAGDLDNRVKTLIDALRMPQQCSEVANQGPSEDEDPFFCLLDDDRLIYEFSVASDRLLVPTEPDEPHRDVVAIIAVEVKSTDGYDPMVMMNGFAYD